MSRPFARGTVVARGRRFGVVWADHGERGLELLEIVQPKTQLANDVLLELSDLIACGAPVAFAVIRAKLMSVSAFGQAPLGSVPGPTMCRVDQALARADVEAKAVKRWEGDRAHRKSGRENMVHSR